MSRAIARYTASRSAFSRRAHRKRAGWIRRRWLVRPQEAEREIAWHAQYDVLVALLDIAASIPST